MTKKLIEDNRFPSITINTYKYTCDQCGKTENVNIGCFGYSGTPENEWVDHRDKIFCCQRCADTFEVNKPGVKRISRREYEEKYGL